MRSTASLQCLAEARSAILGSIKLTRVPRLCEAANESDSVFMRAEPVARTRARARPVARLELACAVALDGPPRVVTDDALAADEALLRAALRPSLPGEIIVHGGAQPHALGRCTFEYLPLVVARLNGVAGGLVHVGSSARIHVPASATQLQLDHVRRGLAVSRVDADRTVHLLDVYRAEELLPALRVLGLRLRDLIRRAGPEASFAHCRR